jgi:[protein-PII] uridylyltransferase
MRELYHATEAVFRGGRGSDPAAQSQTEQHGAAMDARERLFTAALDDHAGLLTWAAEMEDAYFTAFSTEEHVAHYALAQRARAQGGAAASARIVKDSNVAEIVLAARDRRGLFADLAGAISGYGANVVGARVYTSSAGQALDVFYVQDAMGQPYGCQTPHQLERLTTAVEAAARGEALHLEPRRTAELGRAAAFAVAPTVALDNDASAAATVVEVSGRDRPGLLEALARTLAQADLSILSAHVDCYGERAVDAFYVVDGDGGKLHGAARTTALRKALTGVLQDADPEPAKSRPRLERARASVAR